MKRFHAISLVAFATLFFALSSAPHEEDSCTPWNKQPDGSYWRMCTDKNGNVYCLTSKNGTVSRIKCK